MLKRPIFALCVLILLTLAAGLAQAEASGRYALVIGNSAYKDKPLKNPANDARDMAKALQRLGFDVQLKVDAGMRDMEESIREFGTRLKRGGVGIFYYAGHGIQVQGANYLVPIGARLASESDAKFECVDAGRVLGKMEDAGNELNIVILDACRNNPFARSFRSVDQGLARMDAPTGSMVAYATAPNSVASDGKGQNGLYTKHLLANIGTPGIPIEEVFKRVRIGVMNDTGKKQVPWESSSVAGYYYIAGGAAPLGDYAQQPLPQADARIAAQEQKLKEYLAGLEAEKRQVERERAELERRRKELDAEAARKLKEAQAPQENRLREQLAILEAERRKLEQERAELERARAQAQQAAAKPVQTASATAKSSIKSQVKSQHPQPPQSLDKESVMQRLAGVWRIETDSGWRFPLLSLKPGGGTLYGSFLGDERMLERVELSGLSMEDGALHVRMNLKGPQERVAERAAERELARTRGPLRKAFAARDSQLRQVRAVRVVECVGELRGQDEAAIQMTCGRVGQDVQTSKDAKRQTARMVRTSAVQDWGSADRSLGADRSWGDIDRDMRESGPGW